MQLAGSNAFSEKEIQTLFNDEEIELLKHNSLVTVHKEYWSFSNALFQEHLTALALYNMEYSQILSFISVGKQIKKVKTKWLQTTCSLLSLLDVNSPSYEKLLSFLEQDNIELLFTTEKTKFTESQRFTILKKLIDRCSKKSIRPVLVYEDKIAQFIDGDKKSIQLLLKTICEPQLPVIVKVLICKILLNLSSLNSYGNKFYQIAMQSLQIETNAYYCRNIIEVLTQFKLGDKETADFLVKHAVLNKHHQYRGAVYQYIMSKNLADEHYSYGLGGMRPLINYNKEITHSGSE